MQYLRMYSAELPPNSHGAFGVLKTRLGAGLRALLEGTRQAQAQILGISPDDLKRGSRSQERGRLIDGEVYTDGATIILFSLREVAGARVAVIRRPGAPAPKREAPTLQLMVCAIGQTWDSDPLQQAVRLAHDVFGVAPTPYSYPSDRFDELKAEGRESPAPPTPEELRAATQLCDKWSRQLAIAIKTAGGLLVRDLSKQLPPEARNRVDELTTGLKAAQLVDSEIVVVCAKTQSQMARAPSRDALERLSATGIKCACGRPLADERTEEALGVTDLGRALLDKARWLTVLLVQELEALGVHRDAILVEQNVGGDELDCLANISGELALFELKDKEFNLGNAYSFGAKIGIIRPKHPVIVTTEHVGNDAKEHFVRARVARGPRETEFADFDLAENSEPTEITYIEGVANLSSGLRSLVGEIYRTDAINLLNRVLPLASLNGSQIVAAVDKPVTAQAQEGAA